MAQIYLKQASLLDSKFYNELRNDSDNTLSLNWKEFNIESLSMTEQYIKSHHGKLFTAWIDDNEPVGYVKFSINNSFHFRYEFDEIGLFIIKKYRGRGFAPKMLLLADDVYTYRNKILAIVESHNKASLNSFYRAGYQSVGKIPVFHRSSNNPSEIIYLVK